MDGIAAVGFTIVSVVFVLLFLGFIGLVAWNVYDDQQKIRLGREAREEAELAEKLRREEFVAFWENRVRTGHTLSLRRDDRLHLIGKNPKYVENLAQTFVMRRDVYDWCRKSLNHDYSFVPVITHEEDATIIWFEDKNDAMFFKMRWY